MAENREITSDIKIDMWYTTTNVGIHIFTAM